MAVDAKGKQLPAHMEASATGGEITLVVDDRDASYPISIDPVIATVERFWTGPGRRGPSLAMLWR